MAKDPESLLQNQRRLADFLRSYRKNRGIGSTHYAAYIREEGIDPDRDLSESLADADRKHDRTAAHYGDTGESLAAMGGVAGYADYLTAVNDRSRKRAREDAMMAHRTTVSNTKQGYADYIDAQSSKIRSIVGSMRNQGVNRYADAFAYALTAGLDEETARLTANLVDGMDELPISTDAQDARRVILSRMIELGLTRDTAYRYALACGVGARTAAELADSCHEITINNEKFY